MVERVKRSCCFFFLLGGGPVTARSKGLNRVVLLDGGSVCYG